MSAREDILGRVRASLGRQADSPVGQPPITYLRTGAASVDEKLRHFEAAFTKLGGLLHVVPSVTEAQQALEGILHRSSCVLSQGAWDALALDDEAAALLKLPKPISNPEDLREACATKRVGVSGATALLAATGTVALEASSIEPRLISLLPPIHVVIARSSQLLDNLDAFLTLHPQPLRNTSSLVLITGPSRTGDIEMVLVRGVHGPGTIHVIIVKDTQ